ncbi:mannose-1-phosphate guanylyltransferase/mannose-6-phosphate isomerase [Enterovirga aerilata]|uniref:mannose-1-phosphate guanylyltransferase n=1 Tax=Enterovirga aerilata TaxID=2730920 RepID=A0A849ICW8_9HYPH|nr:mannose-1-phosphate guanylyltransferase/mannose-6-phosphate isomerase [Enterovirga sp. DB1703]NNM74085.1 mannose-1-phosphate guanylyltransferase/mannose-6-phosphate isomerase [Enterovirga sp. DB1703]
MRGRIRPLIMCGGAGTRLWPASRDTMPKQFIPLLGNRSSFQETVLRVQEAEFADRPLIVASEAYRFIIERQLGEIDAVADLLLEPARRDSAPAVMAGTLAIAEDGLDTPVLVLAADHHIADAPAFSDAVRSGLAAAEGGWLVTFGITPVRDATEYGYVEPGARALGQALRVRRFVEKPDEATAGRLVRQGCLWNSGNFLFCAGSLIEECERFAPATLAAIREAVSDSQIVAGARVLAAEPFGRAEATSLDYAVMERTDRAAVVPVACGWSDIGNWDALWSLSDRDGDGNAPRGDVALHNASNCLVWTNGQLTSLLGVNDLVVVADRDAILIADRRRSADVKQVVQWMKRNGRAEASAHAQVHRPWGCYESIDQGERYQVKRIVVHPGGRLSLQKHRFRAEHWVVVSGQAHVTVGDAVSVLGPNQHAHIPLGAVHRLENFGNAPLVLIEVQTGSYLGEDDIVRLEDVYHREAVPRPAETHPDPIPAPPLAASPAAL